MSSTWARHHQARNFYGRQQPVIPASRTDLDVLVERHRFIREADEENLDWEDRLARKAYDRLFKEFAVCDLSRYKEKKVAMRWRVASEVIAGKGHLTCGNLRCKHHHDIPPSSPTGSPSSSTAEAKRSEKKRKLQTLKTSFAYSEAGEAKVAEVALVLCDKCAAKLAFAKSGDDREEGPSSTKRRRTDDAEAEDPRPKWRRSAPTADEDDRAPAYRNRDGVYVADGFGSYSLSRDEDEPPDKEKEGKESKHASSYVSQIGRWKK